VLAFQQLCSMAEASLIKSDFAGILSINHKFQIYTPIASAVVFTPILYLALHTLSGSKNLYFENISLIWKNLQSISLFEIFPPDAVFSLIGESLLYS
jgi:hypothetical protein